MDTEGIVDIRITQSGKTKNYINYGVSCLENNPNGFHIHAVGRAVTKAVIVAEILKKSFCCRQNNRIYLEGDKSAISINLAADSSMNQV